jgi:hypothetical protein
MKQLTKLTLSQYLNKSNIYKLLHINVILIFRLTKNYKKIKLIKLINDYIISSTIGKYMNDIGIEARNNFDYKKAFDSWLFGMRLGYMNCYTLYFFNQTMLYIYLIGYDSLDDLKLDADKLYDLINIHSHKHADILALLGLLYINGIGVDKIGIGVDKINREIGLELIRISKNKESLYGLYFIKQKSETFLFNKDYKNDEICKIIPFAKLLLNNISLSKIQQQKIYEEMFNMGWLPICFQLANYLLQIQDYDRIRIKNILDIGSNLGCALCSSLLRRFY